MSTLKKQKLFKLTTEQSKLLFNYNKANDQKKAFSKLASDLKEPAVTIVDANGGQVFTVFKGHNVHAQTKHKEYTTIDLKRLQEDHPKLYDQYKTKVVNSVTLEVNTVKI
jgi:hypothetical protein|tara:strand:- start:387 stop:716 length:330 start_codon:yes stop_codon:yes gene_type:complete